MRTVQSTVELRHLAGLPDGIPTVETPGFRKTQLVVSQAIADNEIAVVTGDAGLGKSFAVDYAVKAAQVPFVWVQVGATPSPKEVTARLARELFGTNGGRRTLYELADDIVEELKAERHIVVVDEAQNLKKRGLDQIRFLHDVANAAFPLLFVGGASCAEVLQSDPQLADRVGAWVSFRALSRQELFAVLDAYHPFFAASDKQLLAEMDRVFAHGVFRRWARVLQKALPLAAKSQTPDRMSPEVVKAVLATVKVSS